MQKAKFLLVAFATAAVISITVGAAGKYVNLNDWGKKHVFITLLGVQTVLLLFLFFLSPKYLLLWHCSGDRGFPSIAATYVKFFRREQIASR